MTVSIATCRMYWMVITMLPGVSNTMRPVLTPGPTVSAIEDERLTFTCIYTSTVIAHRMFWERDGVYVPQIGYSACDTLYDGQPVRFNSSCTMNANTYNYTLVTTVISRADEGQTWHCVIDTLIAILVSDSTTLTVQIPVSMVTLTPSTDTVSAVVNAMMEFMCETASRPKATIRWFRAINTTEASDEIEIIHRVSETVNVVSGHMAKTVSKLRYPADRGHQGWGIFCTATNIEGRPVISKRRPIINILLAPTAKIVNGSSVVIREGDRKATLSCSVTGNPLPTATWTNVNGESMRSEGASTRLDYTIKNVGRSHSGLYSCSASNTVGNATTQFVTVNVYFAPTVHIQKGPTFAITEGDRTATLSCSVTGNPLPTVMWTNTKGETFQSNGTTDHLKYVLQDVDRSAAGDYTCSVVNGIGPMVNEVVTVQVNYAPDVTVATQNGSVNDHELTVTCAADGIPREFTFSWRHIWPGYGVIRHGSVLGDGNILTLTNLTYQQSGLYTCTVWNNVTTSRNPSAGHGSTILQVDSYPVITDPILKHEERFLLAAHPGGTVAVSVLYYSNTGDNSISCRRMSNADQQTDYNCSSHIEPSDVLVPVFTQMVPTRGLKARVTMSLTEHAEFEHYDIFLRNKIGTQIFRVEIIPEGPPMAPGNVHIDNITDTSAILSCTPGFHGGFPQTIVVQLRSRTNDWQNASSVEIGTSRSRNRAVVIVDVLSPNTAYVARMCAYNVKGISATTGEKIFTTAIAQTVHKEPNDDEDNDSSVPVSAIVGGCVAAGIVLMTTVAVLVVVVVAFRSKYHVSCARKTDGQRAANKDDNAYITPRCTVASMSQHSLDTLYERLPFDDISTADTKQKIASSQEESEAVMCREMSQENCYNVI